VDSREPAPEADRALWVWDTSDPRATVDFAVASGISRLYAAVPPLLDSSTSLPQLTELVAAADAAGLRVDALGGDPDWVQDPAWVVETWLQPALATGLFSGVHVDVEPYDSPAWETERERVIQRYLDTYDALGDAAGPTPVEADIPCWFDEVTVGSTSLDREVLRRTSGVTVMAYRRRAGGDDGSIALAAPGVDAGDSLGKPVRIGLETAYLGETPAAARQTFFGRSRAAMEVELEAISQAFRARPSFAGLAIHDAAGYAAMAP
jgi:hypothetical protein